MVTNFFFFLVGYLFCYFSWLRFWGFNLLLWEASVWISSSFQSVKEIGGIKAILKDALHIHSWGCFLAKKKGALQIWSLMLERSSKSFTVLNKLISWARNLEVQSTMHTKPFVFRWHEPGVHIGITFLSEVKLSIQNPYLGRMHIDFRGYFFPENGCVKKVRTSCLSPAAMFFLWRDFQHL